MQHLNCSNSIQANIHNTYLFTQPPAKRMRPEFDTGELQQAKLPSKTSPSKLTKTQMDGIRVDGCIYSHWFAVKLYDLTKTVEVKSTGPTKVTIDEVSVDIERASVDHIVKYVKSISVLCSNVEKDGRGVMCDALIKSSEVAMTALFGRELDRFLVPDGRVGACLHQFPVCCNNATQSPETADLYITALDSVK